MVGTPLNPNFFAKVIGESKYILRLSIPKSSKNLEASKFFEDLGIDNLKIYFDSPITLAKKFGLRGVPTTILINKDGYEFARIVGSIDFKEKNFVEWLASYN